MRHLRLIVGFCVTVSATSAVALADVEKPDVLQTSGAARSGAERAGGLEMTSPPHASTATGQQSTQLSTADTRRTKHPRNRSVVGSQPSAKQKPAKK